MSVFNHTDLAADDTEAIAADVTTPDGELDAAIGNRTTLTTTDKTTLVAAVNEVHARVVVSTDADGTLKAGAVDVAAVLAADVVTTAKILNANVTTAKIADASVTADKLAAAVAGNGLAGGAGTALSVTVDGTTIEISSDTLRILASAFPTPNLMWGAWNDPYAVGYNFDGRFRWFNERALSLTYNDTTNNPSLGTTLQHDGSILTTAGKAVWLSDVGLAVGDTPTFSVQVRGTDGTWQIKAQPWTVGNALVGGAFAGTSAVMDGTVKTLSVTCGAIPATTAYLVVYTQEVSAGAVRVLDIYKWSGVKGTYLPSLIAQSASPEAVNGRAASNGLVFDPTNIDRTPGTNWDGLERWVNGDTLTRVTDGSNPWGTDSLSYAYDAAKLFAGKHLWLEDMHGAVGDVLTFTAFVHGTDGENITLGLRFYDGTNTAIDTQRESETQRLGGAGVIKAPTVRVTVPATATAMKLYVIRKTGATSTILICAMTGYATSARGVVAPSVGDYLKEVIDGRGTYATIGAAIEAATSIASSFPATDVIYGTHLLRDWGAQLAKIQQAETGEQAVVAFIGDSWVDNALIWGPLKTALQGLYGNAGVGYAAASALITAPTGVVRATAGTWATRDNTEHPPGYGVDIASTSSTDVATPASKAWTATLTDARLLYLVQPDGGSFRWRVDAGAWTTVDTDGTLALGTVDIPPQSNASHTMTVEVTVAGVAGVEIMGCDLKILGANGVRLHKLGNGGAAAVQYEEADEDIWNAGLAALAPNLVILLLGTNDHSAEIVPADFYDQMNVITDRIRAARANTDILLLSPTGNNLSKTYELSDYVTKLRLLAVTESFAMVDAYQLMPSYTIGNSRGMYASGTHLNASGGQYVANPLVRVLKAY